MQRVQKMILINFHLFQTFVMRHAKVIKSIMFLLYCCVVAAGFVLALLEKLSFSIFILGVLIFGQIVSCLVCRN